MRHWLRLAAWPVSLAWHVIFELVCAPRKAVLERAQQRSWRSDALLAAWASLRKPKLAVQRLEALVHL
jgi:predicted DCC family thiol-disulfide oxidoreductase YuxK